MRTLSGLVAALAAVVTPAIATAQEDVDSSVEVQLFEPALGPHSFLTVGGAELAGDKQFSVGLFVTYLTNPLTVWNVDGTGDEITTTRTEVVKTLLGGHLGGFYGLKDKYQVGVSVPVVFAMSGDGMIADTAEPAPGGLSVTGLGDARLEFAARVYEQRDLVVAAVPAVTIPTSTSLGSEDNAWLGDDLPTFRPRAAAEWTNGNGLSAAANLGLILRKPRQVYSSEIGQMLTYGVAGSYQVIERLGVVAEVFGRKGFSADLDESPLEIDGALRLAATPAISVLAGGGTGLLKGIGSPGMRLFAAVSFAPDLRDTDGDGVPNNKDRCPAQAEDRDLFRDNDGCVDSDNDEDMILDVEDKCPLEAEDKDGFEDEDGCPEADNDKDGVLDEKDACPTAAEDQPGPRADGCPAAMKDSDDDGVSDAADKCTLDPEDMDGFQDDDGCPEPDNDGDGVPDEYDECPTAGEDLDGFEDDNGCPDVDNDRDGLTDVMDKCPNEAEVVNGVNDFDGCPDTGGAVLASIDGDKVLFAEKIKFRAGEDKLTGRAKEILDQASMQMRAAQGVKKWRVVVAAEKLKNDDVTRKLSQARADVVKAHLANRGVPADAIEAIGAVSATPVVIIVAIERDQPAAPPPAEGGETPPADGGEAPPAEGGEPVRDDLPPEP